jgi:hypothetical protein
MGARSRRSVLVEDGVDGRGRAALELSNAQWRRRLSRRETDEAVYAQTGKVPLSVSTDRIGVTALRCARLLSAMAADKIAVDRSGLSGAVVEVYPAASLRCWLRESSLADVPYKGTANIGGLAKLAGYIEVLIPWLDLGSHREMFWASDDAFDAVICALTARAVNTRRALRLSTSQREIGRREGWIALRTADLEGLLTG